MTLAVAFLPLLAAVLALVVLQRTSRDAGLMTLFVTIVIVLFFPAFHLSPSRIGRAVGEGGATALTLLAILVPALLFYHVQKATGAIPVLERGIATLVPDRDIRILLLVLGVGPAVEALCGFGVGAIIIIPLLAAFETDTLRVAQLSLLSQIIGPWGALGRSSSLAATLSGVRLDLLGAQSAVLLAPISLCFALLTLAIGGRRAAPMRQWPLALGASGLQIGGTFLGSQLLGVEMTGVVTSLLVVVFLLVLGRNRWSVIWQALIAHHRGSRGASPLIQALTPYLLLGTSLVATQVLPTVSERLHTWGVLLPILVHFALLSRPGVCLLFAAITPLALFPHQPGALLRAGATTSRQSLPSLIAIVGFLCVAALMQESGMASMLGSAAATAGKGYMWIAPVVGGVSGWLSGSGIGGNALGVPVQMAASARVGLPLPWVIAAQNTATVMATIVSPTRIVLIITASGTQGQEGALMRKLGPMILWSIAVITVLLVWFLSHGLLAFGLLLVLINGPLALFLHVCKPKQTGKACG